MPQEQYHHQMYDQMQPMHPQNQPQMHPQQPHLEKTWSNPPQETSASNPEPVKPSSEEEDSSSPRKKVSPSKKVKKKVKVKPKTTNAAKAKLAKVVTKKKDKKVSLTKEELAKYPDENLREVVLKMKNGCDCPENCFKRKSGLKFVQNCSKNLYFSFQCGNGVQTPIRHPRSDQKLP